MTGLIIVIILLPIILFINGTYSKRINDNPKKSLEQKKYVSDFVSKIGCALSLVWLICICVALYLYFGNDDSSYDSENYTELTQEKKYSDFAINTSKERVERWKDLDYLIMDPEMFEVHISPDFWNGLDVKGKEEVASTVLVYMEVHLQAKFNFLDFKDKMTDKKIAYWSTINGFEIIN
jgi:hypothetical protein